MSLYLGKNPVSVKFGSKVIKSVDNKELKVLQNGTYTIDPDSDYTGFNPVKVAIPAVGSTITVKNLTGKTIDANDKVWLNYYYKKGDTNFDVLSSSSGYDLGMLFSNGNTAFCRGELYSIGNDSATKLTSFPSQIAYAPCTGFLKNTLYATSAFYGSSSQTHNKWMLQSNGTYVTLGQYMTPLVSNSNSDGWTANYSNNNSTCYIAHYNEKLEQDASFSIKSSSIWTYPIYGTREFVYNDISYSLLNKGKLKLDKENKTISSYSTYSPTNIQCGYPFGMTLDNKILICTNADMHHFVENDYNGGAHNLTKSNSASIQFYELVEDKTTGELTTVRGYTSDEMPPILQPYFSGTNNKASWTWNRFSGVLTGVTNDSIIAIQYKDGQWTSKEVILPNYTPKITDAISFNDDMSVAFVTGSVAKIYNIDDKEEWHAVSYSLANINEDTVTGQAETNAEPETEFPVTIADIGGSISPEPLTVTPSIEDATVAEAQYDEYTSPFTDSSGDTYDGVSKVKVRKIGSWIDSHLSADNIRKDVSVLGVKGNIIELVPETITVSANTQLQTFTPSTGNGFTEVKVNAITLQDKTVTPTNSQQTVSHDSNYTGLNSVTVKAVDATADSNIKAENIKENVTILGVTGTFAGKKIDSYKTATPTTSYQTIRPDEGFDGISYVNVNPVTYNIDSNIKAENIRKNISILGIEGTWGGVYSPLSIAPKITAQTFTPEEGQDGFNTVEVSAVTSNIDSNILPKNIKRGITILGVEGNYIPENLQSKVVNPTTAVQNVTYDDGYEGLNNVQVNAVTSAIDENITAENIKLGVSILGVDGALEEGIKQAEVEPLKNVAPTKEPIVVRPDEGYKALSQVNIEGVSASIDPNILAENIKKGIEILGVTGNLEAQEKIIQNKKEVEPSMVQQVVTPDVGYDALLQVIVKAVTASIDPNILPKNIKKNVSILGVTGTLEEGAEQKWFDFSGISGVGTMNKNIDNGGTIASILKIIENNWELKKLFTDLTPEGKVPSNINAALFDLVYGYDNLSSTDNGLEQLFIFFTGGQLYTDYSKLTRIKDQIRWLYPYTNDYGVDGCLINYTDDGTEKVLKLYVLTDSTNTKQPVPVLVDGTMSASLLPEGFDGFRYVVDMTIPAHTVFDPKITSDGKLNWVLQARKGVKSLIHVNENKPLTIDVSAYDKNFGEADEGKEKTYNFNHPNFNIQGTPTLNNGIASNFSSSDYLDLGNFDFSGDYEIVLKFKMPETDSDTAYYKPFFDAKSNSYFNIAVTSYKNDNKRHIHSNSGNGSSWNTGIDGTTPLELNTEYYVKVVRSGTTRTMYLSTDNMTWSTEGSIEDTYNYSHSYCLGAASHLGSQEIFKGSFDLTKCYIKVNDKLVWVPYPEYTTITSHTIYPLTKDLLFYERKNYLGNLVNYVDNGDAVDIKLYHTKGKNWAAYNRPNVSSNGTFSVDNLSIQVDSTYSSSLPAWKVFDGVTNSGYWMSSSNSSSHWIKWYHAIPVKISRLKIFNGDYSPREIKTYTLSGSNDNSSWVELISGTNSNTSDWGEWYINVNSNNAYSYYKLDCVAQSDTYLYIGEIQIEGETIQENQDLYMFAPNENLGSQYKNVEYIDTISIPEHNIYINENNQWYPAKHITIDVDNADTTIYTEIEG